mmetsp:Transcript_11586/g.26007  ORF Transcript_11586/g.26007 Transcript_11586/m.26007 type:complete len:112 (+) Transcript_11586:749-1084(+)
MFTLGKVSWLTRQAPKNREACYDQQKSIFYVSTNGSQGFSMQLAANTCANAFTKLRKSFAYLAAASMRLPGQRTGTPCICVQRYQCTLQVCGGYCIKPSSTMPPLYDFSWY